MTVSSETLPPQALGIFEGLLAIAVVLLHVGLAILSSFPVEI